MKPPCRWTQPLAPRTNSRTVSVKSACRRLCGLCRSRTSAASTSAPKAFVIARLPKRSACHWGRYLCRWGGLWRVWDAPIDGEAMPYEDAHLSDQELLQSADGELSPRSVKRVNAHLAHCWACR